MDRRNRTLLILLCAASVLSGAAQAGEKAPAKVFELTKNELTALATDPAIVSAVVAENARGKSLDDIKKTDAKWISTAGIDPFMKAMMESECGARLQALVASKPYLVELFVTDNQGANVCMADKTSDYWQGDEAKFQKAWADGAGTTHVADVEFDDSTQAYTVQVSIPVKDGEKLVGIAVFGLDIDKIP